MPCMKIAKGSSSFSKVIKAREFSFFGLHFSQLFNLLKVPCGVFGHQWCYRATFLRVGTLYISILQTHYDAHPHVKDVIRISAPVSDYFAA